MAALLLISSIVLARIESFLCDVFVTDLSLTPENIASSFSLTLYKLLDSLDFSLITSATFFPCVAFSLIGLSKLNYEIRLSRALTDRFESAL